MVETRTSGSRTRNAVKVFGTLCKTGLQGKYKVNISTALPEGVELPVFRLQADGVVVFELAQLTMQGSIRRKILQTPRRKKARGKL